MLLKDFSTGKRVEARYKGRGNWYKGVIANVNPDGTIDVTYDDGEVDLSLHSKYVRLVQEGIYIAQPSLIHPLTHSIFVFSESSSIFRRRKN